MKEAAAAVLKPIVEDVVKSQRAMAAARNWGMVAPRSGSPVFFDGGRYTSIDEAGRTIPLRKVEFVTSRELRA